MTLNNQKSKFLKIYANIPLSFRREIIVVIDKEPVTWNSAKIEIENETEIGKNILDKLIKIGIIDDKNE